MTERRRAPVVDPVEPTSKGGQRIEVDQDLRKVCELGLISPVVHKAHDPVQLLVVLVASDWLYVHVYLISRHGRCDHVFEGTGAVRNMN